MTKNSKVNIYGRVCWKLALLLASIVLGVSAARAETMLLRNGVDGYNSATSGVFGTVGANAAWTTGSVTFRLGNLSANNQSLTDTFQFADSANTGIGTIVTTSTTQTTINSATLDLRVFGAGVAGTYYIAPITQSWTPIDIENGQVYAVPAYDSSKEISFNLTSSDVTASAWFTIDVSSIVQYWVDGGTNYGFALYAKDSNIYIGNLNNTYATSTTYNLDGTSRGPKLSIDYTISAIPEPSIWALLLGGALVLLGTGWYRRRAHC